MLYNANEDNLHTLFMLYCFTNEIVLFLNLLKWSVTSECSKDVTVRTTKIDRFRKQLNPQIIENNGLFMSQDQDLCADVSYIT